MKNFYLLISFLASVLLVACQSSSQRDESKTEGSQDTTVSGNDTTAKTTTKKMTPAEELLTKSIKFHDPDGNWAKFNAQLTLASERPNGPTRTRLVTINNTDGSFLMKTKRDSLEIEQGIANDSCFAKINGLAKLDTTQQKKYRLVTDKK